MAKHELDKTKPGDPRKTRQRIFIAATLLVLTAGAGYAARQAQPTPVGGATTGLVRNLPMGDALGFGARVDRGAVHVGGDGRVHIELTLAGAEAPEIAPIRRATDVVVVLDRSGSMGGDPLAKAISAVHELIGQIGPNDRFALVSYADGANVVIPLSYAVGSAQQRWSTSVSQIRPGGGTNMSAGLDRAHALLAASNDQGRVGRIMLLSDGHANQGDATPEGLSRRAGRAVKGEYVLSTVGVGEGFDERLMTRLADAGTGNFYYVPHIEVLAGIFANEFASARETVASAVEIQIDTPAGIEVVEAAGYPLERRGDKTLFRPGSLFAGQQRSLWVTLRVPSQEAGTTALGDIRLSYTDASGQRAQLTLGDMPAISAVVDETQFVAQLDAPAVAKQMSDDKVNRFRQTISSFISRGDYDAAATELDSADFSELRALGYAVEETESYQAVQELKDEVEKARSVPAAAQPAMRNQLGKRLYESGTDGRRKGAKR